VVKSKGLFLGDIEEKQLPVYLVDSLVRREVAKKLIEMLS